MPVPGDIAGVLDWVDRSGTDLLTAEATMQLGNGSLMSVRAGGMSVHAQAGSAHHFDSYEVDLDHEPARFWTKYTADGSIVYAFVPRLLVVHHVTRRGGVAFAETAVRRLQRTAVVSLSLQMPYDAQRLVRAALEGIAGVSILRSSMDLAPVRH